MFSFNDQIPKKRHVDVKHCVLCKKHGGVHNIHNTTECCRYEKDSTPKKSFAGKNAQRNLRNGSAQREQNNYAQFSTKIAKLEKSNKRLKHANKKCKHDRYSDSEDSDSS